MLKDFGSSINIFFKTYRRAISALKSLTRGFLLSKLRLKSLHADNKDLLKKIYDTMNKVFESEKLRAEAEKNTKAITERKEALEKEL